MPGGEDLRSYAGAGWGSGDPFTDIGVSASAGFCRQAEWGAPNAYGGGPSKKNGDLRAVCAKAA